MLQPLLIEIGVEELPAIPFLKELPNIDKKWNSILEENNLECEFSFYVSVTLIRMKEAYSNYFYKFLLNSKPLKNKASIDVYQGGGVPNLNVKVVREFVLPVPSIREQTEVANRFLAVDKKLDSEELFLRKLKEIKKGLMQDLLTGRVRVS